MTTETVNVEEIIARHRGAGRDTLIPILQEVQEAEGYLSRTSVAKIGEVLGLPASKVYSVATFYNQFRFQPLGRFHIQICRGTACHVKGSAAVLETLCRELEIEPGETTRDRLFSLEVVVCIGVCGLAPVISVGGNVHARMTPGKVTQILDIYRGKAAEDA